MSKKLKLESVFKREEYLKFVKRIKNREVFEFAVSEKNLTFKLALRNCDGDFWHDNLYCCFGASYKISGFSFPFQYDEIPSYEYICEIVNNWLSREQSREMRSSLHNSEV